MDGTNMFSFTSPGLISPAGLAIDDLFYLFIYAHVFFSRRVAKHPFSNRKIL
jgi:hypothetical protein